LEKLCPGADQSSYISFLQNIVRIDVPFRCLGTRTAFVRRQTTSILSKVHGVLLRGPLAEISIEWADLLTPRRAHVALLEIGAMEWACVSWCRAFCARLVAEIGRTGELRPNSLKAIALTITLGGRERTCESFPDPGFNCFFGVSMIVRLRICKAAWIWTFSAFLVGRHISRVEIGGSERSRSGETLSLARCDLCALDTAEIYQSCLWTMEHIRPQSHLLFCLCRLGLRRHGKNLLRRRLPFAARAPRMLNEGKGCFEIVRVSLE